VAPKRRGLAFEEDGSARPRFLARKCCSGRRSGFSGGGLYCAVRHSLSVHPIFVDFGGEFGPQCEGKGFWYWEVACILHLECRIGVLQLRASWSWGKFCERL
jgi:hypothetical protein